MKVQKFQPKRGRNDEIVLLTVANSETPHPPPEPSIFGNVMARITHQLPFREWTEARDADIEGGGNRHGTAKAPTAGTPTLFFSKSSLLTYNLDKQEKSQHFVLEKL